jgi:hypothetical protein
MFVRRLLSQMALPRRRPMGSALRARRMKMPSGVPRMASKGMAAS